MKNKTVTFSWVFFLMAAYISLSADLSYGSYISRTCYAPCRGLQIAYPDAVGGGSFGCTPSAGDTWCTEANLRAVYNDYHPWCQPVPEGLRRCAEEDAAAAVAATANLSPKVTIEPDRDETTCPASGGIDTKKTNSIIETTAANLKEKIDIDGTPFAIFYSSARAQGRKEYFNITVPWQTLIREISGDDNDVQLARVQIDVAGTRKIFENNNIASNTEQLTFSWDGKDAFGRQVSRSQQAKVHLSLLSNGIYQAVHWLPGVENSHTLRGFPSFTGRPLTYPTSSVDQDLTATIGLLDGRVFGLGGWSLNIHHALDVNSNTIYFGDGSTRSNAIIDDAVSVVAASPTTYAASEKPKDFVLSYTLGGTFVGLDRGNRPLFHEAGTVAGDYVVRLDADGSRTVVAGSGEEGFGNEGQLAITSSIAVQACGYASGIRQFYIAKNGDLYFAECSGSDDADIVRIRRIDATTSKINTVVGVSQYTESTSADPLNGDGGNATATVINRGDFEGFAVSPDGWLYVMIGAERTAGNFNYLRRVSPDGFITTVAGGERGDGPLEFGGLTLGIDNFPDFHAIDVGSNGQVYIQFANCQLIRFSTSGWMTRSLVPACGAGSPQNGGRAVDLRVSGNKIYVADMSGARIRQLNDAGSTSDKVVVGMGYAAVATGMPGRQARIQTENLSVASDGDLFFSQRDALGERLLRLGKPDIKVSEDGSQLYVFDSVGRHLKTVSTLTGKALYTFAYDAHGLVTIQDIDGRVTTIIRDSGGTAQAIVAPHGQTTTLSVGDDGYLESVSDTAGQRAGMTYHTDASGKQDGLLVGFSDFNGNQRTYTFDDLGRLESARDPTGNLKTLAKNVEPDVESNQTTFLSPLGRKTLYNKSISSLGLAELAVVRPNGTKEVSTFDAAEQHNVLKPGDGSTLNSSYNPDPRFGMIAPVRGTLYHTLPSGTGALSTNSLTVEADNLLDPTTLKSMVYRATVNNGETFETTVDAINRLITSSSPEGYVSTASYDTKGRTIRSKVPGLHPARTTYDSEGRPITLTVGPDGCTPNPSTCRQYSFHYAADGVPGAGYLSRVTDPIANTLDLVRDGKGRILTATSNTGRPDQEDLSFGFDANGNMTSVVPPTSTEHQLKYSMLDELVDYLPPAVAGGSGSINFGYSADRELTHVIYSGSTASQIQRVYDKTTGELTSMTYPEGEIRYVYDGVGRKLAKVSIVDSVASTFGYNGSYLVESGFFGLIEVGSSANPLIVTETLDSNLRPSGQVVSGGAAVAFQYDRDNVLTAINAPSGGMTLTRDSATGRFASTTLGTVQTGLSYNGFGEVDSFTSAASGADLYDVTYTYDGLGRIATRTESVEGSAAATTSYTYDGSGRLKTVAGAQGNHSYSYDQNGNRLGSGAVYDAQDRLLSRGQVSYFYDVRGSLAQKVDQSQALAQVTNYTYDALGNLRQVALPSGMVVSYVADGLGRRVIRQTAVGGTETKQAYLFDKNNRLVAEVDADGDIVAQFVYATREHSPDLMIKGGVSYRMLNDERGSVRLVVNSVDGSVAQRLDYDPWGVVLNDTNPGFQPFGFAGGIYDDLTGLVRFGARDYDALVGRWTARDPILFDGQQANLYEYVRSDPINLIDPEGKIPAVAIAAGVGAAVGAISNGYITSQNKCASVGDILMSAAKGAFVGAIGGAVATFGGAGAVVFGEAFPIALNIETGIEAAQGGGSNCPRTCKD